MTLAFFGHVFHFFKWYRIILTNYTQRNLQYTLAIPFWSSFYELVLQCVFTQPYSPLRAAKCYNLAIFSKIK